LPTRHGPCADRRREREHRRKCHRNRREDSNQHQRRYLRKRHCQIHGIGDQQNGHAAIGGADELGAAPEFRARPRRYDFGHGFPPADERAGISLKARASFDWHGFAGEHRLVDKDGSVDQSNVGGNDGAQRQLHHIALYQLGRR